MSRATQEADPVEYIEAAATYEVMELCEAPERAVPAASNLSRSPRLTASRPARIASSGSDAPRTAELGDD
jgi:hypothetical protein